MSLLPLAAFLAPGLIGVFLWLARPRPATARFVSLTGAAGLVAAASQMVRETAGGTILTHAFGDWRPPFGILFVVDRLSALFLMLLSVLLLLALATLRESQHGAAATARIRPLLFFLTFGLSGAFMTGDLFNLFVMFEVVLLASYLLLQAPGGPRAMRSAFPNIAINLLASLLFFVGVGVLYSITGTVNMADLALRLRETSSSLHWVGASMLVVAFSVKAGLVPLFFWLPATYPALSGPVAALFAGMMTKLGVYALLRTVPLLMQGTPLPEVLVWIGAASALLGVLAALSEYELRRLLGFHIVSQVGYMVLGLGLLSAAAVTGAIFYLIHHVLVKAALFLVSDELERGYGTRDLRAMQGGGGGGALSLLFVASAFSLAGLPPFSGFFAKIGLFRAALDASAWVALAVLVVASFYTLASMLKIWSFVFLGSPKNSASQAAAPPRPAPGKPLIALVGLSLLVAALAGPVFRFSQATARQLLDVDGYVAAVFAVGGHGPSSREKVE